jgi:hypothetical protein
VARTLPKHDAPFAALTMTTPIELNYAQHHLWGEMSAVVSRCRREVAPGNVSSRSAVRRFFEKLIARDSLASSAATVPMPSKIRDSCAFRGDANVPQSDLESRLFAHLSGVDCVIDPISAQCHRAMLLLTEVSAAEISSLFLPQCRDPIHCLCHDAP